MVDQIRFFAGAARVLEGKSAGEYIEGIHLLRPPGAARPDWAGSALELPVIVGMERHPCAGRGQHGRAEAIGHYTRLGGVDGEEDARSPQRRGQPRLRGS